MNAIVKSVVLCTLLLGVAMPVAGAPVYKWVDENGVVNYSTEPPPSSRKAKVLTSADTKVSSFDPVAAGLDASSEMRRSLEYLRNRADQLQRELDYTRFSRQVSASTAADDARRRRLEECQRQRRVDCDIYHDDTSYPRTFIAAAPVLFGNPFFVAPTPTPPPPRALRAARGNLLR